MTQELRIAAALTGGVSLAVWMGGIARELMLLRQASDANRTAGAGLQPVQPAAADADLHHFYRKLLALVDVTVDIDVLCGSSAGGINAALLGYGLANGKDLGGLRETWLQVASMADLLRDPAETNPLSLLDGDKSLYAGVAKQLESMQEQPPSTDPVRSGAADGDPADVTVMLTTTYLEGETSRFTDSYGTVVQDTDHHGLFTFTQQDLVASAVIRPLALAARSSASFPGAFEASFLPHEVETPAHGRTPQRPAMQKYSNATRSHWAADGGLLANRPLQPILEKIFDRAANHEVRRVLLYIVPTAGPMPSELATPLPLNADDPPSLRLALSRDLGAVFEQSIASDLRSIRRHNSTVETLSDARLQLADLGSKVSGRLLTPSLLADYTKRQGAALVRPVVTELMRVISTTPVGTGAPNDLPKSWVRQIGSPENTEVACRCAALSAATENWTLPGSFTNLVAFGRPAYEGARAIVLSMVRHALPLTADAAERQRILDIKAAMNKAGSMPARPDVSKIIGQAMTDTTLLGPVQCAELAARTYVGQLDSSAQLDSRWQDICTALITGAGILSDLTDRRCVDPGAPADQRTFTDPHAAALDRYLRYLLPHAAHTDSSGRLDLGLRLFDLHAAQQALSPADVEQRVEFIQASADTRTTLDPVRRTAASKLTGMQLQHFGAFYKASWRANDWMWGRIDGVGWLVHMLLEPARVRALGDNPPDGCSAVDCIYGRLLQVAGEPPEFTVKETDAAPVGVNTAAVKAELGTLFLDPPPASLPITALWMATQAQRWVAAREMPVIAREIGNERGSDRWTADEQDWVGKVRAAPNPKESEADRATRITAAFASNPVPGQRIATEVGQPLLTRTVTKAMATGTATFTALTGNPGPLKPVLSTLRTVTMLGFRLTNATSARPKWLMLTGLATLLIGALMTYTQTVFGGVVGLAVVLAGVYLVVLGIWGTGTRHLRTFAAISIFLLLLVPALPWAREGLFGLGEQQGVAHSWLTWLGQEWWHPEVVVGAAILGLCLLWWAAARGLHPSKVLTGFRRRVSTLVGSAKQPTSTSGDVTPGSGSATAESAAATVPDAQLASSSAEK